MDNAWHIHFGAQSLLIDPWLEGVEVDYFGWFNTQWHRTPPLDYASVPHADAVLITQKYPDHCHPPTLRRLRPRQIIAPASLQQRLAKLLPKATVHALDADTPVVQFGDVSIRHLPTRRRIDPMYDAFVLDDGATSVFLAPHGFDLDEQHLTALKGMSPCSLVMGPFNRYRLPALLGGIVAPGLDSLRRLCETLQPKHIARTHDEDKHASGFVHRLARVERFDKGALEEHPWLADRWLQLSDYTPVVL